MEEQLQPPGEEGEDPQNLQGAEGAEAHQNLQEAEEVEVHQQVPQSLPQGVVVVAARMVQSDQAVEEEVGDLQMHQNLEQEAAGEELQGRPGRGGAAGAPRVPLIRQ